MAAKYTKQQIKRNRLIGCIAIALVVALVILLSVSCGGAKRPAEYTESGPNAADQNTTVITGHAAYNYAAPVPERAPVGDDYFSDAIFIGQSLVGGMRMFTDALPTAEIAYSDSASVANGTGQRLNFAGGVSTLNDILSEKQYGKIYLQFGLNELGFSAQNAFYTYYADLVADIRALQPNAIIYLMSVLPVSQSVDANGVYTNAGVGRYNQNIMQIVSENRIFYIDIAAPFTAGVVLNPEHTDTGLNLKVSSYSLWREYILSHTAPDYAV